MSKFLQRFCPFIIPAVLCMIIYHSIDKKYKLTEKISSHIKVKEQWKACFCFTIALLCIFIIGIIGIYLIDMPDIAYSIISGIIAGLCFAITDGLSPRKPVNK